MNDDDFRSIPHNSMPCDFNCNNYPVGWVRVRKRNRSTGGHESSVVYMACAAHITLGEAVYPDERGR